MTYKTQADLARDQDILVRIAACAATQGVPDPESWAWKRLWAFSARPGWDDAYSYAVATGKTPPGLQEDVITDQMILDAVKAVILAETKLIP